MGETIDYEKDKTNGRGNQTNANMQYNPNQNQKKKGICRRQFFFSSAQQYWKNLCRVGSNRAYHKFAFF